MTADLRAALENLARHHEMERITGNTHPRADRCEFVEQAVLALASTSSPAPVAEGLRIGPIEHSNPMCRKDGCKCWCQACERHNWRHERVAEGLDGWRWYCAGCHQDVEPMGMCETCGVFGIYGLPAASPSPETGG